MVCFRCSFRIPPSAGLARPARPWPPPSRYLLHGEFSTTRFPNGNVHNIFTRISRFDPSTRESQECQRQTLRQEAPEGKLKAQENGVGPGERGTTSVSKRGMRLRTRRADRGVPRSSPPFQFECGQRWCLWNFGSGPGSPRHRRPLPSLPPKPHNHPFHRANRNLPVPFHSPSRVAQQAGRKRANF